ncbi:MAG TPA: 4Fe-4S dicluster domain-containing protein [Beijerinckiaceae bacterium]|nr:4Fe-4S dicluster domain-containing protein [Rhodoblastus sp.]MCO5088972.1 4Fe-4S dicluster domain-containing protein [Methylobacteriaceae bacterium]HRY02593.1 4Fe-4S dicluster domain-containing protein [Beijerinckiaceae bacterium]
MNDGVILSCADLNALIESLRAEGRRTIGPVARDGVIVYDDLESIDDLPAGMTDEAAPGHYRLARRDDDALFGYAVGPHSWKRFLHAPVQRLWRSEGERAAARVLAEPLSQEKTAFIAVRGCELAAIAVQDRVLGEGETVDRHYRARRDNAFLVAVDCGTANGGCFCVSMGTGPEASGAYDIALTEILEGEHRFLARAGSEAGQALLRNLPQRAATAEDIRAAREVVARTAQHMGRAMPVGNVRELLARNPDHPRWDDVAARCLSCANCTMVCPTCFCTSVDEASALDGSGTARVRRWDSCFTMDFSYVHGGGVRSSVSARYRQWMTHKLSSWFDQFGTSGCVGCGRCIVWCPVGIDITEEVRAIQASERETEARHGNA